MQSRDRKFAKRNWAKARVWGSAFNPLPEGNGKEEKNFNVSVDLIIFRSIIPNNS
jgi:hypothetical protein